MKGLFNFGRRTTKKYTESTLNTLNNLATDKRKSKNEINNKSRLSFMSSMTDQQKDEPLEIRKERLLENIIKSFNTNNKNTKNLNKNDLKIFSIENNKNDINFLTQIENTNSTLEKFKFTSPKEEGEKCQLVERGILEKFREENSHNEDQI